MTLMSVAPAHAHKPPAVETTITYITDQDGREFTQLIHRVHMEYVMQIAERWYGRGTHIDYGAQTDRLASYVGTLVEMSQEEISFVGGEIEGNHLIVYEEIEGSAKLVGARGLSEFSDDWTHRIDVKLNDGAVQGWTFSKARGTLLSDLQQQDAKELSPLPGHNH